MQSFSSKQRILSPGLLLLIVGAWTSAAQAQTTWRNFTNDSVWTTLNDWTNGVPSATNSPATFNDNVTGTTISLGTGATTGTIDFTNSTQSYTLGSTSADPLRRIDQSNRLGHEHHRRHPDAQRRDPQRQRQRRHAEPHESVKFDRCLQRSSM